MDKVDHKKLLKLAEIGDTDKLISVLKEVDSGQLIDTFESYAVRGKGDPIALLRAIMLGSPSITTQGVGHRHGIYTKAIKLLSGSILSNNTASEMVGVLLMEADSFSGKSLAELANLYVDGIKTGEINNGKAFELFPKLLSALAAKEAIAYGNNEMTGGDYKSHVLNTLCSSKWSSDCVIHLAAMFRDIPLTNEELKFVIHKILRMFKTMDLQELPPLVYQLLLLSTKGHKRLVLEGISDFFNEQDSVCREKNKDQSDDLSIMSTEQLRHMEGTIILHITFAIKQDQELGREFIKYLKTGQQGSTAKILTAFIVALALSIARIHRFEESMFEFLKASIIKSFKDAEKNKSSKWTEELVPESFMVTGQILEAVQNSLYGWDHVTQGLVQLGFILMDSFGPKAGPFGKSAESSSHIKTPSQQACDLGSKVLLETFKVHEMVRSEILEQILNRVVTKTTAPVSHYIDLLSNTTSSAPQILLDSLPKVREAFDYLTFLPTSSSEGLLRALQPLMKISMTLKDSLMLVLRKAMFSRQRDARKIAVTGFLKILKHFKVFGGLPASQSSQAYSSSSQIQVDVHSRHNPASNEALCLEILGNLRRCFGQQADVRLILYEGLYKVLKKNSQLKTTILEMLLSHLKTYYESSTDVNPPVLLEPCITAQGEQVFLTEPLAHLLCCITQSLMWLDQRSSTDDDDRDDDETSVQGELEEMVESITRRMIKSEMEDFELDKSADFSLGSGVGIKNNIFAIVVMGVYEVLMEYQFTGADFSPSSCEEVLNLFLNYNKLSEILKEKANSAAGKKGRGTAGSHNKTARSLLSIEFVTTMLRALVCDDIPSHQESLKSLREDHDFIRYIVNVSLQKIQQVQEKGQCDGPDGSDRDKIYKYCTTMARVMLKKYSADAYAPDEHAKKEKGKALSSLCLDGVHNVINIMCSRYQNRVFDFLQRLNIDEDTSGIEDIDEQDIVHQYIKQFQRLTMNILNATDDQDVSTKDAVQLCHIISVLAKYLSTTGQQFVKLHSWVTKICKEQNLDDSSLTKVFLSLLFLLTSQSNTNIVIAREVAQDIHSQVGDVDQDVEVEDRTHFAIINPRTAAPTVLLLLMNHVEKYLDETEWVLALMRADAMNSNSTDRDSPGPTQQDTLDKAICTRMGTLVTVFHELVQTALPVGMSVDSLVKTLTRVYSTLALLAKYYLVLYSQRVGHLSVRFEKLVKLTGTHLTQQCYAMINYIQTSQNEHSMQHVQTNKGSKLKDKKKQEASSMTGKVKILKETKSIPNLIFSIEQYEKFLIQLSKKSKINLMEHFKLSTSRDFRINTAAVQAALQQQDTSSSEDEEGDEEESDGEKEASDEPLAKKSKTTSKGSKLKKGSK